MDTPTGHRIHFLVNSPFPNYTGGRETWLYNVVERLATPETPVHIVSVWNNSLGESFQFLNPDVQLSRIRILTSFPRLRNLVRSYLNALDMMVFVAAAARRLRQEVRPDDIVIALGTIEEAAVIKRLSRKRRILPVCSVRGFHAEVLTWRFPLLKRLWYCLERKGLEASQRIWCNGFDTLAYVRKLGFEAVLVPNGVNVKHYAAPDRLAHPEFAGDKAAFADTSVKYLVATATLLPVKGIREFLTALSRLKTKVLPAWKAVWIGKGDPSEYLSYAGQIGVRDDIIFLGERRDTAPYLQAADIVLCLSGGGGLAMATLEAMASGKPIVAWDSSFYRQLLRNDKSAVMVQEKDAAALAGALEQILVRPEKFASLGIAAQKDVEKYDWEAVVQTVREQIRIAGGISC
jgi:glycosyltransferase involved in cell wall biosynthesis